MLASAVLVAALGVAVTGYAASAVVAGRSMSPTLEPGQRILVDPFAGDYTPVRLAVVVADRDGTAVVKRVVGVPGDRVRMVDGRAQVRPEGVGPWLSLVLPGTDDPWDTPRLCCAPDGSGGVAGSVEVPAGRVWLLGDNLAVSDDSRAYGFVPVSAIEGPVWLRTWPLDSADHLVAMAALSR
ncbi:signal peptidase I [Actinokineospora sp. UTMC 2448]|uniref:signal peptidase I n=1 Tax=Actinokineospora sp. UTMC 2448 TaxID=2268449 RepID=UPI002164BB54|nr:signal peptidase I [Actinokineospora sp. UTMC 2448]